MASTNEGVVDILNGQHLRISGNQFPPYVFSRFVDGDELFSGANFKIINSSASKCNFTFELDAPPGRGTGSRLPDGTWDGIFAEVFYNRADLAIVLGHTYDRHGLVDFTSPFGAANLVFSTALPSVRVKPDAIFSSFTPAVWLFISLSLIGITFIVYLASRVRHQHDSIQFAMFYVFRVLMDQEAGSIPSGLRVISAMYLSYVIIIGTGYKSNLLAALSFPHAEHIPTSFEQLAGREDYEIYFDKSGTVGYNYFKQANNSFLVNIRDRFEQHLIDNDPAKCVTASFLGPKTACIAWDTVLDEVTGRNLSLKRGLIPIFQTRTSLTQTWVTIGLQKNSQYTAAFTFISSSFYETGLVSKWHQDIVADCVSGGLLWMRSQMGTAVYKALSKILQNGTTGARPLPLENMYVVFALYSLGMAIAVVSFSVEAMSIRLYHHHNGDHKPHVPSPFKVSSLMDTDAGLDVSNTSSYSTSNYELPRLPSSTMPPPLFLNLSTMI